MNNCNMQKMCVETTTQGLERKRGRCTHMSNHAFMLTYNTRLCKVSRHLNMLCSFNYFFTCTCICCQKGKRKGLSRLKDKENPRNLHRCLLPLGSHVSTKGYEAE